MKKKIALLLAGVMALSTLPMSVFAADTSTSVRVPGILNANSDRSKTIFTNNEYPGLSILRTTYATAGAVSDGYSAILATDTAEQSGTKVLDAEDAQDIADSKKKANNGGYDVADSVLVSISDFEAEAGQAAQFDVVLTNGSKKATWGEKFKPLDDDKAADGVRTGFDAAMTNAINGSSTLNGKVIATRNPNVTNTLTIKVVPNADGSVVKGTIRIPVVATAGTNAEPLMVSVRGNDDYSNVVSATSTVASVSNDTNGGNTTTSISKGFSGKNRLSFDILTKENVSGTFGSGSFEGTTGVEKVTYTVNSNFKFANFNDFDGHTSDLTTDYSLVSSDLVTADYGVDVKVYARIGTSANKLDVKYVFGAGTPTKVASSVKLAGIQITPKASTSLGQEVTLSITPDSNSEISKQDSLVVGNYSDYSFKASLFDANKEVVALQSGKLEFVPYEDSDIVTDDDEIFDEETTSITVSDEFEDTHKTSALKVSENVARSFIDGRTVKFELPEEVEIIGYEITNLDTMSTSGGNNTPVYFYEDATGVIFDHNVLKLENIERDPDSADTTDLASFAIVFYVAADANFSGDVNVVVSGDAIGGEELDAVKVATFAPGFKVNTGVTTIKSGVQESGAKDIVISETETGRFEDGETVYVNFDTFSTAVLENAIKLVDADISVTNGDLEVEKLTIDSGRLSFKVANASSTSKPSTITLSNVKVSTAYGLPETSSYPFAINVSTDRSSTNTDGNYDGNFNGQLNGSSIRYGALKADYINVKNNAGAANGDIVTVQSGSTTYTVNGVENTMDAAPFIDSATNSMMVPVRFIADGVGITEESGNLIWSAGNKTVILRNGNDTIEFPVGANYYRINGAVAYNDNNAVTQIVEGRTYVPFRTMGSALAIPVSWDEATRTARYN